MAKSFLIAIITYILQEPKEVTVHYILQPHHVFIVRVKVFILMLVPAGLQLLIIITCFAWRPGTSINKSNVLTARAHENCYINTWLSFH